ncbi:MAG TPA: cytochrome c biogenesis protein CcsA [Gemmatimonadales bacterium]|nr:cytochrome c biogenesis protein CcsA [Gemmatimonadales bacterium]
MKLVALASVVLLMAAAPDVSTGEAARVAIQHEGRVKPFDTFARQLMQYLSEKERFRGYSDPETGSWVDVFPEGDPVAAVLKMIADPRSVHAQRFIKIGHPGLKAHFGLEAGRTYFSLKDLEPARDKMIAEARQIDEDAATSEQRATMKIVHQFMTIESLYQERILTIFPIPYGENRTWATPVEVRMWLDGHAPAGGRAQECHAALTAFAAADASRRSRLQAALDHYSAALDSLRNGDTSRFAGLANELRALNPEAFPSERRLAVELKYNRVHPFHIASGVFFLGAIAFLMALVFKSTKTWIAALIVHAGALGLCGYGYALRWIIADRYPLSNHYESMIMCAIGASLLAGVLELIMRPKAVIGLGGSIVASLLLVLANNVPAFAEQGFVAPLVPALQTVWMTIHVPIIMTGYAMGMLLMVMGHLYLVGYLKSGSTVDEFLDRVMRMVLQLTVLFLLFGIILGAVWAGEAWGRPWGWDMKETWALITLLCYLAILHGRFLGALRTFGTAIASLGAFQILILTYYGVNFLFGKGLHTYGFGAGEVWPLIVFFIAEAVFAGVCLAVHLKRGGTDKPATETHDMIAPGGT